MRWRRRRTCTGPAALRRRRARRGASLVELLVVLAVSSVLLTALIVTTASALATAGRAQRGLRSLLAQQALARAWRADVVRADDFVWAADAEQPATQLRLFDAHGEFVTYTLGTERVVRVAASRDDGPPAREEFALGPDWQTVFEIDAPRRRVALVLRGADVQQVQRAVRLSATLQQPADDGGQP